MKKAYDYGGAKRLIPLLRTIHREIRERSDLIRKTAIRIKNIGAARPPHDPKTRRRLMDTHRAEIANHKREIRHALSELTRLGCLVDEECPGRVLIPGVNGALDSGYAWNADDSRLHAREPEGTNTSS